MLAFAFCCVSLSPERSGETVTLFTVAQIILFSTMYISHLLDPQNCYVFMKYARKTIYNYMQLIDMVGFFLERPIIQKDFKDNYQVSIK